MMMVTASEVATEAGRYLMVRLGPGPVSASDGEHGHSLSHRRSASWTRMPALGGLLGPRWHGKPSSGRGGPGGATGDRDRSAS